MSTLRRTANGILKDKNYDFELKEEQEDVIAKLISGKDVFAMFPTGYGKSLCYIMLPFILDQLEPHKDHICLVISPLKALINDQVRSLRDDHQITCTYINQDITIEETEDIRSGNTSIVFTTPEMAVSKKWKQIIAGLKEKICCIAYDEAHCISEWGLDFRPDYKKVGVLQCYLECPILALTATATVEIKKDVEKIMGLKEDTHIVTCLPARPNIFISLSKSTQKEEELDWVKDTILTEGVACEKILIYVNTIAACERLYIWFHSSLKEKAYDGTVSLETRLIEMYHSHTDNNSKERIMSYFSKENSPIRVLVATVACGMGLDIPDIRIVVL